MINSPDRPSVLEGVGPRETGYGMARQGRLERLTDWLDPPADYNFEHYRLRHLLAEFVRTYLGAGVQPGAEAPDFELTSTRGTPLRLDDLRGRPVLLHFVSYTCPITRGGSETKRELHRLYGDRVQFVDVLVRQAHPGGHHGPYRSFEEKLNDARDYEEEEAIGWPVVVDDLPGSVQKAYGTMCAPVFLIDAAGRVAFYGMWGPAPPLRAAMDELLERGGSGAPARQGVDRVPHLAAAIVYGRRGPARGGWRALVDLELGFPGAFLLMTLGALSRPILGPLVRRTTPIPRLVKAVMVLGAAVVGAAVLCSRLVRSSESGKRIW